MADEGHPDEVRAALFELTSRLDTVAGAVAAIASTQTDLLAHVAETEARRAQDALEVSQRLTAIERQALGADQTLAEDVRLALDVLAHVAEGIEQLDQRTEDRLAGIRDAATGHVDSLPGRIEEVSSAVQALTRQLPELGGKLTLHTDTALAGALRLIDDRLAALRSSVLDAATGAQTSNAGGFEAGAVIGAAQAAWNRLEQRLDTEFDDLGRQLQAIAGLLEQTAQSAEVAATRPVVTGEGIKRAATAVRDTVVSARRSRRDRRGGPKGLGPGSSG
jgi:hypothetical protein